MFDVNKQTNSTLDVMSPAVTVEITMFKIAAKKHNLYWKTTRISTSNKLSIQEHTN